MKKIILCDNEEWLKNREVGIGGSDCACIVGCNPYKTVLELWQEKVNYRKGIMPPFVDNEYTRYGKACEDAIRQIYSANMVDVISVYHNSLESCIDDTYAFMKASLDGELTCLKDVDLQKSVRTTKKIHLKAGMKGVHEIKTCDITHKNKFYNDIPINYLYQIMHYLMITHYDFACCTAMLQTRNESGVIVKNEIINFYYTYEELAFPIEELRKAEIEFWKNVEEETIPKIII